MSENSFEQARTYVETLRQKGHTDEQIRQMMLKAGWTQEQLKALFAGEVPQAATRPPRLAPPSPPGPRPSAERADVGGCPVAWILLVSLFLPPAGLIIGLIWLASPQPAKKQWGIAGIAVSLALRGARRIQRRQWADADHRSQQ